MDSTEGMSWSSLNSSLKGTPVDDTQLSPCVSTLIFSVAGGSEIGSSKKKKKKKDVSKEDSSP